MTRLEILKQLSTKYSNKDWHKLLLLFDGWTVEHLKVALKYFNKK